MELMPVFCVATLLTASLTPLHTKTRGNHATRGKSETKKRKSYYTFYQDLWVLMLEKLEARICSCHQESAGKEQTDSSTEHTDKTFFSFLTYHITNHLQQCTYNLQFACHKQSIKGKFLTEQHVNFVFVSYLVPIQFAEVSEVKRRRLIHWEKKNS